eukprot:scaffold6626_cov18-Tisochrysis_lutea.AAC.2
MELDIYQELQNTLDQAWDGYCMHALHGLTLNLAIPQHSNALEECTSFLPPIDISSLGLKHAVIGCRTLATIGLIYGLLEYALALDTTGMYTSSQHGHVVALRKESK